MGSVCGFSAREHDPKSHDHQCRFCGSSTPCRAIDSGVLLFFCNSGCKYKWLGTHEDCLPFMSMAEPDFSTHDLRPHRVTSDEGPHGATHYRVRSDSTEWLVPDALRVFRWVSGPDATIHGVPADLDDIYVKMYAPRSDEQYMVKTEYEAMQTYRDTTGDENGSNYFTTASSDDPWVRETHRLVAEWNKPLTESEKTPGSLRWRTTIHKIEERAKRADAVARDDELFVQK